MKILILSCSIRSGRNTPRVAKFFKEQISARENMEAEIFDLKEAAFPLFEERLSYLENPPAKAVEYATKVDAADAVIIACPEYNGGYPAAFKNAFDLIYSEWKHKPIGIASVSGGVFAGSQVTVQLQSLFLKVGAVPIGAVFPVPRVSEEFDEDGITENERTISRAGKFLDELSLYAKNFSS